MPLPAAIASLSSQLSSHTTSSDPEFLSLWQSIDALQSSLPTPASTLAAAPTVEGMSQSVLSFEATLLSYASDLTEVERMWKASPHLLEPGGFQATNSQRSRLKELEVAQREAMGKARRLAERLDALLECWFGVVDRANVVFGIADERLKVMEKKKAGRQLLKNL